MRQAESKIAGLEAFAITTAQQLKIDAFRRQANKSGGQCRVIFFRAVVQKLNGKAVARPIERTGGGRDAQRQVAFIADRQLHQHMRQFAVGELRHGKLGCRSRNPNPGQQRQLNGQHADGDQNEGKAEGQDVAHHGESLIPKASLAGPHCGGSGPGGPCCNAPGDHLMPSPD